MKLKVPFYKQTTPTNCGPMALKMVFSFFGKDFPIEKIEEKTDIKPGKATSTLHIAKAAADLGFKIKLVSKSLLPVQENLNSEFHKKFLEEDYIQKSINCFDYLKEKNIEITEKSIELNELLSYVTEESVPIVIMDWNVVKNRKEKGYFGHFVPVVGYDGENIYIHNHGFSDTKEFMPISRALFDEARKAKGTDEDILIIFRNKNENI